MKESMVAISYSSMGAAGVLLLSFILNHRVSSFILHPSSFRFPPSSFILAFPAELRASAVREIDARSRW